MFLCQVHGASGSFGDSSKLHTLPTVPGSATAAVGATSEPESKSVSHWRPPHATQSLE